MCILSENSVESLLTIFAAALFNIKASLIASSHAIDDDTFEELLIAAKPFAIVVGDQSRAITTQSLTKLTNIQSIIDASHSHKNIVPESLNIKSVTWKSILSNTMDTEQVEKTDRLFAPIQVVYPDFQNNKFVASVASFTHHNITSAISSILIVIPPEQRWSSKDVVLTFATELSMFTLISQLAAVASGASLTFAQNMDVPLLATADATNSTVLITDNDTSLSFLELEEDFTPIQYLRFIMNKASISRGKMSYKPVVDGFKSIKQIHTSTNYPCNSPPPQLRKKTPKVTQITSSDANLIRSISGAHFIQSLCSPVLASPISQTTIWDYREDLLYTSGEDQKLLINYGAVQPCIESKVVDLSETNKSSQHNEGILQVRGNSVSGSPFDWIDTGIVAKFTDDGCLRIKSKEKII